VRLWLLIACVSLSGKAWSEDRLNVDTKDEFVLQQCHAFADAGDKYGFDFSRLASTQKFRDSRLYISDHSDITADWIVIDTTSTEAIIPNALKLPTHTLKYKKFLQGRNVLLLGNGKNYALLESNALWLRENMAIDVKIWLGGKDYWSYITGNTAVVEAFIISAAEFVSEADTGKWIYLDTDKALSNAINVLSTTRTLDRYLVINPELKLRDNIPLNALSSIFWLDGGISSLEKYAYQQGVILTAKKNRESHQKCGN
jgi:serine protease inhibitor